MTFDLEHRNFSIIKMIVILGEVFLLNLVYQIVTRMVFDLPSTSVVYDLNFVLEFNLCYFISVAYIGINVDFRKRWFDDVLKRALKTVTFYFVLIVISLFFTKSLQELRSLNYHVVFVMIVLVYVIFVIWRYLVWKVVRIAPKTQPQRVVILGSGSIANNVYTHIICNPYNNLKLLGAFDNRSREYMVLEPERWLLGTLDDLVGYLQKNRVDIIICALPAGEDRYAVEAMKYADDHMIRFFLVPDFIRFISNKTNLYFVDDIPLVQVRSVPLDRLRSRVIKRVFDFVFSTLFLCTLFIPILIAVVIAIKLDDGGDVFFCQTRTGREGKSFQCLKFRSMKRNAEANTRMATKDDDRLTKVGKFLRKTNLDELPQFINVWLGEMSIVGPRPFMVSQTERFRSRIPNYMQRHLVKPGITGMSQISGYRGEVRTNEALNQRSDIDIWYVEHWSFMLDIRIIVRTVLVALKGDERAY